MAQTREIDYIVNAKINKAGFNALKNEIQSLKSLSEKDLINIGSAKSFTEAQAQLKSIKTSAAQVETALNKAFSVKLGTVSLSKFNNELKGLNLKAIAADFSKAGAAGTAAFNNLAVSVLTTKTQIKETNKWLDEMGKTMSNTIKWGLSSSAWNTMTGSFQKAYNYAKDLDKSLNNIRIVSEKSADDMARFAVQANRAAKALGSTTLDYTDASLIYYQQGLPEQQIKERTEATVKLSNVLGISAQEVSDYMTAIWNNFDDGSKSIEYYADVITKLGAATASSAEEISTGLEKFAAIADTVGLSYEYATAALTTVTATTRQSAEVVGTAFKTLFARIQDLELGNTLDDGVTLGKYSEALQAVGISIVDTNGNLRNMDDILKDMGSKWETLNKSQQVSLAQTVAGTRQYTQLVALMDNWDDFNKNVNIASSATGELNKQQGIYLESTQAHLDQLNATVERLYSNLIDSEGLNDLIDVFSNLITGVSEYVEAIGGSKAALTQIGAILTKTFSRTISQSIATTVLNFKKMTEATKDFDAQAKLLQQFRGVEISSTGYNKILDMITVMNKYKDILSEVQVQEANTVIQEYNQAANERDKWVEAKSFATDYYSFLTQHKQSIDMNDINAENENEYQDKIRLAVEEYQKGLGKAKKEIKAALDNQEYDGIDPFIESAQEMLDKKLIQNENVAEKLQSILVRYNNTIKSGTNIMTEEDQEALEDFAETYGKAADDITKNGKKAQKAVSDAAKGMESATKDSVSEMSQSWDELNSKFNTQAIAQSLSNLTSQIMSISTAISSIKSMPSIWNNENLTTGEKILQTFIGIVTAGQGLLSVWRAMKSITTALTVATGSATAAEVAHSKAAKSTQTTLNKEKLTIQTTNKTIADKASILERERVVSANASHQEIDDEITFAGTVAASVKAIEQKNKALGKETPGLNADLIKQLTKDMQQQLAKSQIQGYLSEYGFEGQYSEIPTMTDLDYLTRKTKNPDKAKQFARTFKHISGQGHAISRGERTNFDIGEKYPEEVKELAQFLNSVRPSAKNDQLSQEIDKISKKSRRARESLDDLGSKKKSPFEGLKQDASNFVGALKAIPPQAYLVAAAVAAIGLAIYAAYREATKEQRALEEATKHAEHAKKAYEETKTAYDELKASIADYQDAKKALDDMVVGTQEWKEMMIELNEQVLSLLKTYPELSKYISRTPNGLLSISDEGIDYVLDKQAQAIETSQIAWASSEITVTEAEKTKATSDLVDELANFVMMTTSENHKTNVDLMEDILPILKGNEEILSKSNSEILEFLKSNGINYLDSYSKGSLEKLAERLKENKDKITDWSSDMDAYTKEIGTYTDVLESITGKDAPAENSEFQGAFKNKLEYDVKDKKEYYEQRIKEEYSNKEIAGMYTNEIGGEEAAKFKSQNLDWSKFKMVDKEGEVIDENITIEEAISTLAAEWARQDQEKRSPEDLNKDFKEAIESFNYWSEGFGDFLAHVSQGDVNDFYSKEEIQNFEKVLSGYYAKDETGKKLTDKNGNHYVDENWDFKFGQVGIKDVSTLYADVQKAIKEGLSESEIDKKEDERFDAKAKSAAKGLEVSEEGFVEYTEQLIKNSKALEENDEFAIEAAKSHYQLSEKLQALSESLEDNKKILNKWRSGAKLSADEMETVGKVIQSVKDVLGTEVSNDFVQEHLSEIYKLAKGDTSVLDDLQQALAEDYILNNIYVDDEKLRSELDGLASQISNLDLEDIKIGTKLNESSIYETMQALLNSSAITAEQANKILGQIGYSPEVEYVDAEITDATGQSATLEYTDPATGKTKKITNYATTETKGTIKIPVINGDKTRFKGLSAPNFNFKPKSKSGGGGGSSKPQTVDRIEDKADRYHDVDVALKHISNAYEKINKQAEKLTGKSKLDNLTKQFRLLNKEIESCNDKIEIAKGEMGELQGKLSGNGVKFNADGTIANYEEAYNARLNYVNSIIDHYNSLSAKGQEKYQKTLDKAKEDFDKFKEDISRYDELTTDVIPDIENQIQDAIDKQIELKIEAFNMEIEIRLDMSQAERDWNEFHKKVVKGIDDEDIIGNFDYAVKNFKTYLTKDGTGEVPAAAEQVRKIKEEIEKMEKTGSSDVYGKDKARAMQELKDAIDQSMESLTEMQETIDQIKESYLSMMDEAKEKFDEQVAMYEQVASLIDHDMNLISLVYGDEAYGKMSEYYKKQKENNASQLDFLSKEMDFWKKQMDSYKEGSKEWENAKEKWLEASEAWAAQTEKDIQTIRDEFLNAINEIFQELNNKMTGGMGLGYIDEQWNLINKNAEQYLDSVNAIYSVQQLQNKYLESINSYDSVSAQSKLNDLMEQEISYLQEQDKLSQYDIDRAELKYQIALKQIALEEAQQNKSSMRLRRDSQGNYSYQYTADNDQVSKIRQEISDLYNQLYNLDADQYRSNLEEYYSVWVEFQEKMAEAAQINDPEMRAQQELLIREQYGDLINILTEKNELVKNNLYGSTMSHLFELYDQNSANYEMMTEEQRGILDQYISAETETYGMAFNNLFGLYDQNLIAFENMSVAEQDILMNSIVPTWNSGVQQMIDMIVGEGGFEAACAEAFEQLDILTKNYDEAVNARYEKYLSRTNEVQTKTAQMIKDNDALLKQYQEKLDYLEEEIQLIISIAEAYDEATQSAKNLTQAAYDYWAELKRQEAEDAKKQTVTNEKSSTGGTPQQEQPKDTVKNNTNTNSLGYASNGAPFIATYTVKRGDTLSGIGSKYGVAWRRIYTENKGVIGSNPNKIYPGQTYKIPKYLSGGYTGDWAGNGGQLAMLHKKELVLNAKDTQNMLNAIEVLRSITNGLNSTLLNRLANVSAGAFGEVLGDGIVQNVHISAEFPNATSSREIEDALNNLVNRASQEIHKK